MTSRPILAAIAAFITASAGSDAAVIANESFDYGASTVSLNGLNGGSGFAGAWSASWFHYTPAGLSFSDLEATAGAASLDVTQAFSTDKRAFSTALTGIFYVGFLFRIDSNPSDFAYAQLNLSDATHGLENTATFQMIPNAFNDPNAAVATFHNGGSGTTTALSGSGASVGATYLFLGRLDATSGFATHSIDGWVLTPAQFDNFKGGGLTVAELNSAALGAGATDVLQRGSASRNGTLLATDYLHLFDAGGTATFDEIRISDTSLTEVAPTIPEPNSVMLILVGALSCLRRRSLKPLVPKLCFGTH